MLEIFGISVLMIFTYTSQSQVYFQPFDSVFELKIPNKKHSLIFISEVPQRCLSEASIPESAGR